MLLREQTNKIRDWQVLDLMVRILGFSEEDKQRIGFAQHAAGKGVVRGVLGLPRSLVGGILGGRSTEVPLHVPSESQVSFCLFIHLWIDFLFDNFKSVHVLLFMSLCFHDLEK